MSCMFLYEDRILDSVYLREYPGQRKPVLRHILRSANQTDMIPLSDSLGLQTYESQVTNTRRR